MLSLLTVVLLQGHDAKNVLDVKNGKATWQAESGVKKAVLELQVRCLSVRRFTLHYFTVFPLLHLFSSVGSFAHTLHCTAVLAARH